MARGKPWTDDQLDLAKAMRSEGKTYEQIGKAVGRTGKAVWKKLTTEDPPLGATISHAHRIADTKFAKAMAGATFEDARVPRERRIHVPRPATHIATASSMPTPVSR